MLEMAVLNALRDATKPQLTAVDHKTALPALRHQLPQSLLTDS